MICIHCTKVIHHTRAIKHPTMPGIFYCPRCRRLLHDFGKEQSRLSPPQKIKDFDKQPDYIDYRIEPFFDSVENDAEILACKDALAVNEQNNEARLTLAKLYFSRNKIDLALQETTKVVENTNYDEEAISFLAQVHASKGDYRSAAKCSLEILKRNPENSEIRYNYGIALFYLGDYSVAANQFYKVLKADPTNKTAKRAFKEAKKYLIQEKTDITFNY